MEEAVVGDDEEIIMVAVFTSEYFSWLLILVVTILVLAEDQYCQ